MQGSWSSRVKANAMATKTERFVAQAIGAVVRPLCEADEALQVVTTGACLSVGAAQSCAVNYRS